MAQAAFCSLIPHYVQRVSGRSKTTHGGVGEWGMLAAVTVGVLFICTKSKSEVSVFSLWKKTT